MNVSTVALSLILRGVLGLVRSSCVQDDGAYFCDEIPQSYPDGLSSLVLRGHNVGVLNSTVFISENLGSVTRLTIQDAGITEVTSGALKSFHNLKTLNLGLNLLSQLSPAWFSQPAILQTLTLNRNNITVLEESMLLRLTGLTNLNLAGNMIQNIGPTTFFNKTRLASLDLSNNGIQNISPGTFSGLAGLTLLNLTGNKITVVSPDCFSSLTGLTYLDLSDNRLSSINPQALPLISTRIRLDRNPWNCSCGVEDFVVFLRGLQNSSLLERGMEVTCASPEALKGQPVLNISECVTPTPQSEIHTPQSDSGPTVDGHPHHLAITVPSLAAVIVVLCVLLFVVGTLAIVWRRKRDRKQVKPNLVTAKDTDISRTTLCRDEDSVMAKQDPELATTTYRSGVRAKSANAVLSTAEFCRAEGEAQRDILKVESDFEALDMETRRASPFEKVTTSAEQSNKALSGNEPKQLENGNLTRKEDLSDEVTSVNDRGEIDADGTSSLHDGRRRAIPEAQDSETIQYLTIGADPAKPNPEHHELHCSSKVMVRVFTWPLTSAQWHAQNIAETPRISLFANPIPNLEPEPDVKVKGKKDLDSNGQDPEPGQEVKNLKVSLSAHIERDPEVYTNPENLFGDLQPCQVKGQTVNRSDDYGPCQGFEDETVNQEFVRETDYLSADVSLVSDIPVSDLQPSTVVLESTTFGSSPHGDRADTAEETGYTLSGLDEASPDPYPLPTDGAKPVPVTETLSELSMSFCSEFTTLTPPNQAEDLDNEPEETQQMTNTATPSNSKSNRKAPMRAQREGRSRASGECSGAPPGAGFPSDDSMLMGNEYANIDHLHEVVRKQGQWTRQRWRQTHLNKVAIKRSKKKEQ